MRSHRIGASPRVHVRAHMHAKPKRARARSRMCGFLIACTRLDFSLAVEPEEADDSATSTFRRGFRIGESIKLARSLNKESRSLKGRASRNLCLVSDSLGGIGTRACAFGRIIYGSVYTRALTRPLARFPNALSTTAAAAAVADLRRAREA